MSSISKRPPYSKRLADILKTPGQWPKFSGTSPYGHHVSIYVIAGSHAWHKAHEIENSHAFLLLPPFNDPFLYTWSILAGHDPIIVIVEGTASPDELLALATALTRDGVNRVLFPKSDGTAVRLLSNRVIGHE